MPQVTSIPASTTFRTSCRQIDAEILPLHRLGKACFVRRFDADEDAAEARLPTEIQIAPRSRATSIETWVEKVIRPGGARADSTREGAEAAHGRAAA